MSVKLLREKINLKMQLFLAPIMGSIRYYENGGLKTFYFKSSKEMGKKLYSFNTSQVSVINICLSTEPLINDAIKKKATKIVSEWINKSYITIAVSKISSDPNLVELYDSNLNYDKLYPEYKALKDELYEKNKEIVVRELNKLGAQFQSNEELKSSHNINYIVRKPDEDDDEDECPILLIKP